MTSMASGLNHLMAQKATPRSHAEVAEFFAGLELVEPGLVRVPAWRPTSEREAAAPAAMWSAVARKPSGAARQ